MAKAVLIVDDDPDFLELMETALTPEGYQVVSCAAAGQALRMAQQLRPDIAIVDLAMPICSGEQLIAQLKSDPLTAHVKIIVCTAASARMTGQLRGLQGLIFGSLQKPFELDELYDLLAQANRQSKAC